MSHDPSRKQFFAKLLGVAAVATIAPGAVAKTASSAVAAPGQDQLVSDLPVTIRPEARAVARRTGSV